MNLSVQSLICRLKCVMIHSSSRPRTRSFVDSTLHSTILQKQISARLSVEPLTHPSTRMETRSCVTSAVRWLNQKLSRLLIQTCSQFSINWTEEPARLSAWLYSRFLIGKQSNITQNRPEDYIAVLTDLQHVFQSPIMCPFENRLNIISVKRLGDQRESQILRTRTSHTRSWW